MFLMISEGPNRELRCRFWTTLFVLLVVVVGLALFRRFSGRILVIDQPARADVILVLDGDSNDLRLQRAVNLLRAEYGKTILLDERTDQVQFGRTQADAAQEFIARRHLADVEVCPGRMVSTAEEVEFAAHVTDVEDHSCGAGIVGPLTRMSHVLRLASG